MMAMTAVASVLLIVLVLMDAFETMLLPRRVTRQFRFARLFYVYSWTPWAAVARHVPPGEAAEHVPQPLRAALDPGPDRALGGRADRRVRPAALVARHAAGQPRRGGRASASMPTSAASPSSPSATAT